MPLRSNKDIHIFAFFSAHTVSLFGEDGWMMDRQVGGSFRDGFLVDIEWGVGIL
jgi:hypothetical protein